MKEAGVRDLESSQLGNVLSRRWGGGRGRVGDRWRSMNFGGLSKGGSHSLKGGSCMENHSTTSELAASLFPAPPGLQQPTEKCTVHVWHLNLEGRDPVFPQQPYP